ncbi:unnamed protein product [Taenia asiatica]|uniref:Uncharacterized protein n=1 Tax=Taenia asiatica TaxID=60517 RepID=A0A0R3VYR6_TAEAS|nr:unnamed protein product [Taenia asiatica]
MGETDEPLHRPVVISCHTLSLSRGPNTNFTESSGSHGDKDPSKQQGVRNVCKRRIVVRDPLNNIVHQCNNVQPLDAIHLVHNLMNDTKERE